MAYGYRRSYRRRFYPRRRYYAPRRPIYRRRSAHSLLLASRRIR